MGLKQKLLSHGAAQPPLRALMRPQSTPIRIVLLASQLRTRPYVTWLFL